MSERESYNRADALERLLAHPDEARRLAQAARQEALRAFDIGLMQRRYAHLLMRVQHDEAPDILPED